MDFQVVPLEKEGGSRQVLPSTGPSRSLSWVFSPPRGSGRRLGLQSLTSAGMESRLRASSASLITGRGMQGPEVWRGHLHGWEGVVQPREGAWAQLAGVGREWEPRPRLGSIGPRWRWADRRCSFFIGGIQNPPTPIPLTSLPIVL